MKLRLPAVLVFVASVSGCFPYHFTTLIGVSGTVVDDAKSTPIPKATVILSGPDKQPAASTTSDASGHFTIAPRQAWWIYIVPGDVFAYPTYAKFSALGFESNTVSLLTHPMGPKEASLGDVKLKPSAQ